MSDSIYKEAAFEEVNFYRLMSSAVFGAGAYISPTEADISEAGPEWKPRIKQSKLDQIVYTKDYLEELGITFFDPENLQVLPVMEVEEISNPTKKAVDEFVNSMKKDPVLAMAFNPKRGTPEDEKAFCDFIASKSPKVDTDLFDDLCEMIGVLPTMEVEELEVINIELSDYPLPENPTSYDWWWA